MQTASRRAFGGSATATAVPDETQTNEARADRGTGTHDGKQQRHAVTP
jgi:hypothetical protein